MKTTSQLTQSSTKSHRIASHNTLKDTYNERFNSAIEIHTLSLDRFSKPLPLLHPPAHPMRATSHMRPRACDHYTSSTLIGGKKMRSRSKFTSLLRLRDQLSMWKQDGCKVYMDSCMASNGSYFMVTWTIFKIHLLEVGLTQNGETIWHSECSEPLIYSILLCARTCMNRNSLK